jgi:inosine-uridine nucleoside N-ribohydrolase
VATRYRVIVDNDFSGDPDDLFQLAHHVLSPSVEIPFVIGSHLAPGDFFDPSDQQADNAARIATELLALLGSEIPVLAGSNTGLDRGDDGRAVAKLGPASEALIREAMRDDARPLFVALGAGMTDLASAVLAEPRIADRLTAVWIGGPEHEGLGLPFPLEGRVEYNLNIDIRGAQVVFDSGITIWQVPRNTYRQALFSVAELDTRVRPHGALGRRLAESIDQVVAMAAAVGILMGETYCLGDQPLVLLTALQSTFEADPSSSSYVTVPTPRMSDAGWYEPRADGHPMRVYTRIDTRLMFEDMAAKLELFARQA